MRRCEQVATCTVLGRRSQCRQRSIAETTEERLVGVTLGVEPALTPVRLQAWALTGELQVHLWRSLGDGDRAGDFNRCRRPLFLNALILACLHRAQRLWPCSAHVSAEAAVAVAVAVAVVLLRAQFEIMGKDVLTGTAAECDRLPRLPCRWSRRLCVGRAERRHDQTTR